MDEFTKNFLSTFGVPSSVTSLFLFIFHKIWEHKALEMNKKAKEREDLIKKHAEELQKKNEELLKVQEQATQARVSERNLEMAQIKKDITDQNNAMTRHIAGHATFEKAVMDKIDTVYERLNPIGENVKYIQGMMEILINGKENKPIRNRQ
jgi:glutaminase